MPTKKEKQPLSVTHPELAMEADGWDPSALTFGSAKKVNWRCSLGHSYQTTIVKRTSRGHACPYCSGHQVLPGFNDLMTTHPQIAFEALGWDARKVSAGSNLVKLWKCSLEHSYQSAVAKRSSRDDGCPYCSGHQVWMGFNDLATTHPELSTESIDGPVTNYSSGSNEVIVWQCNLGHKYRASIAKRAIRNHGCPYCSGHQVWMGFNDLATTHPELIKELINPDKLLNSRGSKRKLRWRCSVGHEWVSDIAHRVNGRGCPSCAQTGFDPNQKGFLYFLAHPHWAMYQIGITNYPDNRLNQHKKIGWELLEIRGPMDGHLTQQWETAILRMMKAKGADLSNPEIAGKFDGYSEAWSKTTFEVKSIKELMRLTEDFEGE